MLEGGNAAWFAAQSPIETGIENSITSADEVRYKPYDHDHTHDNKKKHTRAYLGWEVAPVEPIKRDPTIRFRAYG